MLVGVFLVPCGHRLGLQQRRQWGRAAICCRDGRRDSRLCLANQAWLHMRACMHAFFPPTASCLQFLKKHKTHLKYDQRPRECSSVLNDSFHCCSPFSPFKLSDTSVSAIHFFLESCVSSLPPPPLFARKWQHIKNAVSFVTPARSSFTTAFSSKTPKCGCPHLEGTHTCQDLTFTTECRCLLTSLETADYAFLYVSEGCCATITVMCSDWLNPHPF